MKILNRNTIKKAYNNLHWTMICTENYPNHYNIWYLRNILQETCDIVIFKAIIINPMWSILDKSRPWKEKKSDICIAWNVR